MNASISPTDPRPEMPTNVTRGLAADTALTCGPSPLQNGQYAAQNHSTTGLPLRLAPLNGAPDTVVPVKSSRPSARALGARTRPADINNTATTTATVRVSPRTCWARNFLRPPNWIFMPRTSWDGM
ncbi:Uncharacterised protein [Mycobacteroides abscessus subsp. abscessus]|nr:Uncharacterised protein [Mycobacteroides abscessus subsp. abscessus]